MNTYLLIAVVGLILKLGVTYNIVFHYPRRYLGLRPELMVFIAVFLAYSLILILLFGPERWALALNLERIYVIRLYYFGDGVSLIVGGYLLMSMFEIRFHRHWVCLAAVISFVAVLGYFLLLTPHLVDGIRPGPRGIITLSKGAEYQYLGQIFVGICTLVIIVALYRSYQAAKSNQSQIQNVYALAAALVYDLSCFFGLYFAYPYLMASRGIVFYLVVMLILQSNRLFDLRSAAPATLEATILREFKRIFRDYASEDKDHRDTLKELETHLVAYKLEKISGFKEGSGSSLPQVADSMGLKLSSLYDLLKRLGLKPPPR
ncbi:MAG: hypothetical protein AAF431_18375 [Pseudomonadota bacterium]